MVPNCLVVYCSVTDDKKKVSINSEPFKQRIFLQLWVNKLYTYRQPCSVKTINLVAAEFSVVEVTSSKEGAEAIRGDR